MGTANNAGALIRTMLALRAQRKTGVLEVTADDVSTRVFVLKGMPIFAEEATMGEPLGRLLVRLNVLTQEQHVQVIDCMTRSLLESEQVRYGEVAVELGFLQQDDLHGALVDQVRWRIVRALQRDGIEWRFEASEDGLANVRQLLLPIESLALDAARSFSDERRSELALAAETERFPLLIGDPTLVAERFEMSGAESRFLLRVDGSRTVGELLAAPRPGNVDVPAILTALVLTGAAGMVDERHEPAEPREALPSPARVRVPSPRPSSPPNSATNARLRAARAVARLKQAREESARHADHRAEQRAPATEHEARILAEHAFQRGKAYLRANHLGLALPELRRAFELQPESLEYQLYATWVASRSRERPTTDPERTALARLARAAAHHDPNSAFAQYVLGHVALLEGADALARDRFQSALKLDPHAIDAERHIRLLALRHRGKKPGTSAPPPAAPIVPPAPLTVPGSPAPPARSAADAPKAEPHRVTMRLDLATDAIVEVERTDVDRVPLVLSDDAVTVNIGQVAPKPSAPSVVAAAQAADANRAPVQVEPPVAKPSVPRVAVSSRQPSPPAPRVAPAGDAAKAEPPDAKPAGAAPIDASPDARPAGAGPVGAAQDAKPAGSSDPSADAKPAGSSDPSADVKPAGSSDPSADVTVPAPRVAPVIADKDEISPIGDADGASGPKSERRAVPPEKRAAPHRGVTSDSVAHAIEDEDLELISEAPPAPPPPPVAPVARRSSLPPPPILPAPVSSAAPSEPPASPSRDGSQGSFWTGVALVAAAAGVAIIVHGWQGPSPPAQASTPSAVSVGAVTKPAASPAPVAPDPAGSGGASAPNGAAAVTVAASSPSGAPGIEGAASVAPSPGAAAPSSAAVAPPASAVAPTATVQAPSASAIAASAPSSAPTALAAAGSSAPAPVPEPGPNGGILLFPRSAEQHRIYIDGKLAGHGSAPMRVACGAHTVQIGSAGKTRDLDVPCGGRIDVGP